MNILKTLKKYEAKSMHGQLPVIWKNAKDSYIYDNKDKRYIDFTSGICVTNTGHSNKAIKEALIKQISQDLLFSYTFPTEIRAKFIKKLIEITPNFCRKVFLLSSGTEATECACKLMRLYAHKCDFDKSIIISFYDSMHGRTMLAQALKGKECSWVYTWDIEHLPFPDEKDSFDEMINFIIQNGLNPKKICGFMIESYQGWSARFYPNKYLKDLQKFAKKYNALLCFDEIQGGFGRTGKLFAYQHYDNIEPDLICVGKGISSALPLSGVLGRKEILDIVDIGQMSSTFSANPLCCAVGLANIQEIMKILPFVAKKGELLHKELRKLKKEVNGKGLLASIITDTTEEANNICYKAMEKGLLLIKTDRNSVKIAPPLTISEDLIIEGVNIIKGIIK